MAGIFTRPEIAKILGDENLTADERLDRIMSLRGRDLDEGYVSKSAAKAAQETALNNAKEEWQKSIPKPNIKESEEYKALQGEFDAYRTMQTARTSEDFSAVKPKFFETVYNMVDRKDGAKPVKEQLEAIQKDYDEYFVSAHQESPKKTPQFSQQDTGKGTNPTSKEDEAYQAILKQWG